VSTNNIVRSCSGSGQAPKPDEGQKALEQLSTLGGKIKSEHE